MANETRGNPFETNVLVKYQQNQQIQKSYFIHELPPNCTIDHLRERIKQTGVPFSDWELVYKPQVCKKSMQKTFVLNSKKTFDDYGIKCWDCVYVVPRNECQQGIVGAQKLLQRIGENVASALTIWGKKKRNGGSGLKGMGRSKTEVENTVNDGNSGFTGRSSTLKEQRQFMSFGNRSTSSLASGITSLSIFQPEDDIKPSQRVLA
ncbi:hypothetical protein FB645_002040 [Coemansia sp. IMI 203386]|nr:hypothetical protein FB645_002040 [Coemansia sp. IMI 203386]